ncbi:MAG: hypothetical protein ACLR2O_12565 [Coprococcus sp.]
MKGIKIELLGIAIIPLGIAVTTNNFWGYVLGVLGFGVAVVGCFQKIITDNFLFEKLRKRNIEQKEMHSS